MKGRGKSHEVKWQRNGKPVIAYYERKMCNDYTSQQITTMSNIVAYYR
jgi:hypothetical protein